jgi:predicted nucleotidyltransferase component of viral defense system
MLHLKTVHKETLLLLQSLAADDVLTGFALAGGTALSLQLGHRISVDLDFFTNGAFDSNDLFEQLRSSYEVHSCSQSVNSLTVFVNVQGVDVKVDFLRHNYPLLVSFRVVDGIRFFSLEDITAMKLNAVANRGAKKDFYDIHALLKLFSLTDMLHFFEQKYEQLNSFTVLKSLIYFADAEIEPEPVSLGGCSWEMIKDTLRKEVSGRSEGH